MNTLLAKCKKPLAAAAAVLAVALVVFLLLLVTSKGRIDGNWSGGPVYLEKYGTNCYQYYYFSEDGYFESYMTDASGNTLKVTKGTWEMDGFDVRTTVSGEIGTGVFHFNPLTGKLTSGWWTYEKD